MRDGLIAFLLRLFLFPRREPNRKRGLLVIQIDGLAYDVLVSGMLKGYCPFLRRLEKRGHQLMQYYSGVPSMTNAQLAALMYGVRNHIPGFTWYDRKRRTFIRAEEGKKISEIESELAAAGTPLFTGGSVICSPYTAGATMTDFSPTATLGNPIRVLMRFRILFLYLLHPFKALRVWTSVTYHQLLGLWRMTVKRSRRSYFETVRDMAETIFLGELVRFTAIMDIRRNTPSMFVDFTLYDEYAHAYGRESPAALSALRFVDWCCESVYTVARSAKQKYDIVFLSDHGQNDALPFSDMFGIPFDKFLSAIVWKHTPVSVAMYDNWKHEDKQLLSHEIVAVPCGGYVHIYFTKNTSPMNQSSIETKYPGFIDRLLAHPGIGWVLVRTGPDSHMLRGKNGSVTFANGKVGRIEGMPFAGAPVSERDLLSFAEYAQNVPTLGDVIAYGAAVGDKIVGFERQASLHGGFFGPMMHPFIMTTDHAIADAVHADPGLVSVFGAVRRAGGISTDTLA